MGLGTHFRQRLRSCNRNKIDSESATGSYTVANAVQSRGRMNTGRFCRQLCAAGFKSDCVWYRSISAVRESAPLRSGDVSKARARASGISFRGGNRTHFERWTLWRDLAV